MFKVSKGKTKKFEWSAEFNTENVNTENECIMAAMQKKINELEERQQSQEKSMLEIFKLADMNDKEIFTHLQYKKWSEMHDILAKYLCRRFNLNLIERFGIGTPCIHHAIAFSDECLGQTFERHKILEAKM